MIETNTRPYLEGLPMANERTEKEQKIAMENAMLKDSFLSAFRAGVATLEAYWREGLKDLSHMIVNAFPQPRNMSEPGSIASPTQREVYQNRYGTWANKPQTTAKEVSAPQIKAPEVEAPKVTPVKEPQVTQPKPDSGEKTMNPEEQVEQPQEYQRQDESMEAAQAQAQAQAEAMAQSEGQGMGM